MTQPDGLPTTVGQADSNPLTDSVIQAAVRDAIRQTSYNNPDLPSHKDGPSIGTAPPVPQPGRPAMSERATDASVMMIAGGFLSLCLGAAISGVLYFSSKADPTVIIVGCAAPPAAFLALKSLVKGVKKAALPDVHHHNYNGPVHQDQRNVKSKSVGVWVKNNNQP